MTFHYRIFVVFVFDKISKGMLVTIEKELGEMHCSVRYLFDFDLKIHSGQVCITEVMIRSSRKRKEGLLLPVPFSNLSEPKHSELMQ